MKKFFSMMAAVVAVFTFAACGNDDVTSTSLDTPVIKSVKETAEGDGFVVTWGAVSGATDYVLMIQGQAKTYSTKQTSYTVTDLTMGTYKVMVKAVKGTTESSFSAPKSVTIAGPKTVDWFTQTLALAQDNEENTAMGINSSNMFIIHWEGDEIDSISYAIFYTESLAQLDTVTFADVEDKLMSGDELLDKINAAGGANITPTELVEGGTEFTVCVYVTKGKSEFFTYSSIKTNPTISTTATQAWLGTWSAMTEQVYHFEEWDETTQTVTTPAYMEDKVTEFTLEITPDPLYSDGVVINGLSSIFGLGDETQKVYAYGTTGYGENGEFILGIMNYVQVAKFEDGSAACWLAYCSTDDEPTFVSGNFYAIYLIMDGDDYSCELYSGALSDETPFEVMFLDIAQVRGDGRIGVYEADYRSGYITITGKDAEYTPVAQALNAKQFVAPAVVSTSMVVAL